MTAINGCLDGLLQTFRRMAIFEGYIVDSPESPGMDGDTPLHVAAFDNDVRTLEMLMPFVKDIDVRGGLGYTPLHSAISRGCLESADFLVSKGASLAVRDDYDETPLQMMMESPGFAIIIERYGLS